METLYQGHQHGARKDHVSHPLACSKNNISMINVVTLRNINTKITECKLRKILFHKFVPNW